VRLDAIGVCVTAPILTNAAYPELVRRYVEGTMVALAHKTNARILAQMETAAGAAIASGGQGSVISSLNVLEWQADTLRAQNRLALNSTIEIVLPFYVKGLIRSDLANRGGVDLIAVNDAYINSYFSVRNLRVQFVYDWKPLTITAGAASIPATTTALMYPAGSWVKGTSDVISLDAVYDNASLKENLYTAIFAEEGVLAVQRCLTTVAVTLPICVTGAVGAASITTCLEYPDLP
jgi:hypothetical protein